MPHKKRICHITTVHPVEDIRIFLKECRSLAEFGYEVHLIAPAEHDYQKDGVQIHALRAGSEKRISRALTRVQRALKLAKEIKPDLVHFHDVELLRLAIPLKRLGIKVVYDSHEDTPKQILSKYYIPLFWRKPIAQAFKTYEHWVTSKIDLVVGATPEITGNFERRGLNAINVNNFPLLSEFKHLEARKAQKQNVICYAGGISIIRSIEQMIAVAQRKKDIIVRVAGRWADEKAQAIVEGPNVPENFEFLGVIDREGIAKLYEQSIAGFVALHPAPNHMESLPIKMFEYMAAGVPVIASNFPVWQRIVEESGCGFCVDPFDIDAIVECIDFLIENPEEVLRMGEKGREAVISRYNWEAESEKLNNAYEQILSE